MAVGTTDSSASDSAAALSVDAQGNPPIRQATSASIIGGVDTEKLNNNGDQISLAGTQLKANSHEQEPTKDTIQSFCAPGADTEYLLCCYRPALQSILPQVRYPSGSKLQSA
jgi:hypothetical protein